MKYHIDFDIDFKRNEYPGQFYAVEGIDGSGKSTQVERIKEELEKKGRTVHIKNPFEGELGQFVRTILSGDMKVPPVALQYLIAANRQVQQEEIIDLLKKGEDVIIDRYFWSAVVYGILDQEGVSSREEIADWFLVNQSILSFYHQFIVPNKTFFLKISPETAVSRLDQMDKEKEIYENSEKIKKTAEVYDWVINKFQEEFVIIDGEKSVEDVTKEIVSHL